jgi:hypothetical protein
MHLQELPCYAIATQERQRCEDLLTRVRSAVVALQATLPVTQTHRMTFWVWNASNTDKMVTNELPVKDADVQALMSQDLPTLREFLLHNNFPLHDTVQKIQYVTRIGWWPCRSAVGCPFCLARPHFPTLDDEDLKWNGHVNFFKESVVNLDV